MFERLGIMYKRCEQAKKQRFPNRRPANALVVVSAIKKKRKQVCCEAMVATKFFLYSLVQHGWLVFFSFPRFLVFF